MSNAGCDSTTSGEHHRAMRDVAAGKEPVRIPLEGVTSQDEYERYLGEFEEYITDSVLPDGTPLALAPAPALPTGPDSDEDEDDDEAWACSCSADGGWTCTSTQGDSCDCVASFGNFYSPPSSSGAEPRQTLNLAALPPRLPLVECSPHCPCAARCANRVTQQGVSIPCAIRPTTLGLGLFYAPPSTHTLPIGTFVSLYAGELLTTAQARLRWHSPSPTYHTSGQGNYTLSLRLPGQTVHIDPRRRGNVGRFLNHSCEANCMIEVVRWGGGRRVWPRAAIFTKREVRPGEELTFDYGDASGSGMGMREEREGGMGPGRTRCLCGAKACRGWMPFDESL